LVTSARAVGVSSLFPVEYFSIDAFSFASSPSMALAFSASSVIVPSLFGPD
jgi:hypothetical protein